MVAVLQLDAAGVPHRWIGIEDAAIYSAKGLVLWEVGTPVKTLRGGINARTGVRSEMDVKPVIALAGGIWCAQEFRTPACGTRSDLRARPLHLRVLRAGILRVAAHGRSHRAGVARWRLHLHEPRGRVPRLQRQEGRAHSGGSWDAADLGTVCTVPQRGVLAQQPARARRSARVPCSKASKALATPVAVVRPPRHRSAHIARADCETHRAGEAVSITEILWFRYAGGATGTSFQNLPGKLPSAGPSRGDEPRRPGA